MFNDIKNDETPGNKSKNIDSHINGIKTAETPNNESEKSDEIKNKKTKKTLSWAKGIKENQTPIVIDTNILIDNPEVLLNKNIYPVLPYMVLSELDNLKRNPDLKRAAQTAIKLIYEGLKNNSLTITNIPTATTTPDERIVKTAKSKKIPFMSEDIGAKAIAVSRNVEIFETLEDKTIDYNYKGYRYIEGNEDYEKHLCAIKECQPEEFSFYVPLENNLKENEYIIVKRLPSKEDIWLHRENKLTRISQSFKPLRDAGLIDSPLDSVQMATIHAIMDNNIPLTVLDGKWGTGKSILSLMGALATTQGQKKHRHYEKICCTRPPISVDTSLKLGYLPGTLEEKLGDWLGGIKSNLKFLLEKTDEQKEKGLAKEVFDENFEVINLDSIQGMSLHNRILIVDEFQLLNENMLKLVLSRIAEGSKVILAGDTALQTYGVNRANEGFKPLYRFLGKVKEMSFIKLENIYRSSLTEFVDKVFND